MIYDSPLSSKDNDSALDLFGSGASYMEADSELHIQAADLLKLHELTTRLLSSSDLSPLLGEILKAVTQLHSTDMGTIVLSDSENKELYLVASRGLPEAHVRNFQRFPVGTGPCGIAVKTGRRVVVQDVANDARAGRVRAAGGLAFYQSLYSTPLVTHSGKVIGSLANFFKGQCRPSFTEMVLVDLYARHAAEFIDNAQLSEKAEEAQRLLEQKAEELEHFVYSMAHDLKEPLRTIATFTQMLSRQSQALDPSSQQHMKFVTDGAKRMMALISDLVAYARLENKSVARTSVDTSDLVQRVLLDLQVTIGEQRAEVTCSELPVVSADEKQLALVFQNLIANAVKFHKKGARPAVHISAEKVNGNWRFSIRDNGIGIAKQHQSSVFQVFRRLNRDSDYAGSGIGLASCKKIIERHNGRIWVQSIPEEGSTFYFVLG